MIYDIIFKSLDDLPDEAGFDKDIIYEVVEVVKNAMDILP